MRKKYFTLGALVAAAILILSTGQVLAQESKEDLLQPQADTLMTLEPNLAADTGRVLFTNYRFEQASIKENEMSFLRAFKFKTPPWEGKLIWSFSSGGPSMKNVYGWGIVAAQGDMTGFRSYEEGSLKLPLQGAPKDMPLVLQEHLLKPNTDYIIFFASFVDEPFDVWISLNIVKDTSLTYRELFSHIAEFK